jgi:hypothetical protein
MSKMIEVCGKGDISPHIIIVTYTGIFFNAFLRVFCPIFAKKSQKDSRHFTDPSKTPFFSRFGAKNERLSYRYTLSGLDKNEK